MSKFVFRQSVKCLNDALYTALNRHLPQPQYNDTWNIMRHVANISKIPVKSKKDALFDTGQSHHFVIGGPTFSILRDRFHIPAFRSNFFNNFSVDVFIREQAQTHTSASSSLPHHRSRLYVLILQQLLRVRHRIGNVLFAQLRVGARDNVVKRVSLGDQVQNVFYQNTCAGDTRLAVSNIGVESDVRMCHTDSMPGGEKEDKETNWSYKNLALPEGTPACQHVNKMTNSQ